MDMQKEELDHLDLERSGYWVLAIAYQCAFTIFVDYPSGVVQDIIQRNREDFPF